MATESRTTAAEMVAEAKRHVENLTPAQLREPAERAELRLGYTDVAHLDSGLKAWKDQVLAVEPGA
jgi:rhodanese-related sulfurtransferase